MPTPSSNLTDYTWSPPGKEELYAFCGIATSDAVKNDESYVPIALQQASDLFFLACEVENLPTSGFEQRLMKNAICEMAMALALGQPYKAVLAGPFSTERMGNYSYTKIKSDLADGVPTGLSWFDEAIEYFVEGHIPLGTHTHGMEDDDIWVSQGHDEHGEPITSRTLLGPADLLPDPFGGESIPLHQGGGWDDYGGIQP